MKLLQVFQDSMFIYPEHVEGLFTVHALRSLSAIAFRRRRMPFTLRKIMCNHAQKYVHFLSFSHLLLIRFGLLKCAKII